MGTLTLSQSFQAIKDAAQATADEIAERISSSLSIPVTTCVGQGGVASLLLEASHESGLLVVGSRGRGGFARLALGSTSTQCATHSTTPVAVIPAAAPIAPVASIVVAFDGSANSVAALKWAAKFAAAGSVIECVSVWDTTPIAIGADQFFFPEASGLAEERFEHLVSQSIDSIGRDDIEIRHRFVVGQPRSALEDAAATTDLLVMGARGQGGISASLLGSVSTWLLHHVHTPMAVVPDAPPPATDVDTDTGGEED